MEKYAAKNQNYYHTIFKNENQFPLHRGLLNDISTFEKHPDTEKLWTWFNVFKIKVKLRTFLKLEDNVRLSLKIVAFRIFAYLSSLCQRNWFTYLKRKKKCYNFGFSVEYFSMINSLTNYNNLKTEVFFMSLVHYYKCILFLSSVSFPWGQDFDRVGRQMMTYRDVSFAQNKMKFIILILFNFSYIQKFFN